MTKPEAIIFGPLPPPHGGVSIFMSAIAEKAAQFDVRVWFYKGKTDGAPPPNFRRVDHRRFEHLWAMISERRGVHISDSTHFHLEYPHPLLLPLWLAAKFFRRFRWIKILHDGSLPSRYEKFNALQRFLFRTAVRQIDEFTVCNRELEIWLREKIGADQKIIFIPTLLPLPEDWENGKLDAETAARLARFARHQKRVCSIGVFIESYGFQKVAGAVEILRQETGEDLGLLLVDGGFDRDDDFRARVLEGRDWIETVENVPHRALSQIFRQSDVFVRAFAFESYGLSRIEALWCGVPVIATDIGETRGMLTFQFEDQAALIHHLRSVLDKKAEFDLNFWAARYKSEAEENLKKYMQIIMGDEKNKE